MKRALACLAAQRAPEYAPAMAKTTISNAEMAPFKQRLTALWKMRGFRSRAQFLRTAQLENQTVARWEQEATAPQVVLLQRAADALCVSVDVLLGREPLPSILPRVDQDEHTALAEALEILGADKPTAAQIRWVQSAPDYRTMTAGQIIDALRSQRVRMTAQQIDASRTATEAARKKGVGVPPRRRHPR